MHVMVRSTIVLALLSLVAGAAAGEHPMRGSQAPDFRLESLDGETVALSDFRGDYVVLHFGAGW